VPGRAPHGRPKRSLGQNFLVDANLQRKIVGALGAGADDEVLEIGPGRGALTRHLVGSVGRLVLVELDDDLAARLSDDLGARPDVDVVHGDVLEVPLADRLRDPGAALIIGNIPYNITTPIVFKLLERPRPRRIVLMVQDDVADRIVAPVGTKAYGALSIGVRTIARAEKLFRVGRRAFRPVPGVDSAILRIEPMRPEPIDVDDEAGVRRLVRAAFQWRRKQIAKTLRDHPDLAVGAATVERTLATLSIAPEERPERLSPERFVALARALDL
jgi:16S rRNA (adenine1518-N6/adenine1519-N6)-dimethyltransferase